MTTIDLSAQRDWQLLGCRTFLQASTAATDIFRVWFHGQKCTVVAMQGSWSFTVTDARQWAYRLVQSSWVDNVHTKHFMGPAPKSLVLMQDFEQHLFWFDNETKEYVGCRQGDCSPNPGTTLHVLSAIFASKPIAKTLMWAITHASIRNMQMLSKYAGPGDKTTKRRREAVLQRSTYKGILHACLVCACNHVILLCSLKKLVQLDCR